MNGSLFASEIYVELSDKILELLVIPAVAATLLAVLVLLVNVFARKWLTAGQMALLWALVLIRLAMPFGPESSVSLQNLIFVIEQNTIAAERPIDPWRPVADVSQWPVPYSNAELDAAIAVNSVSEPETGFTTALYQKFALILSFLLSCLPLIWLAGALFLLVQTVISHWRFTRKVNRIAVSKNDRILQLWSSCCQNVSFREKVPVVVLDEISQPAVIGLFRPRLLLPSDVVDLEESQLRLIMLHELAHLIRRDLWVNWILFGVRLLHWWNPTYWLAASRYCSLREQSRDAMVLRWVKQQSNSQSQTDCSREYSELLLTLAQRPDAGSRWRISLPVSMLGFLKKPLRKRSLTNRLKALRSATYQVHPFQKVSVMVALFLFTVIGLTDAKYPPMAEPKVPLWTSTLDVEWRWDISDSGPVTLQAYDLTRAIQHIREQHQMPEQEARKSLRLLIQTQLNLLGSSNPVLEPVTQVERNPQVEFGEGDKCIIRAPAALQKELKIFLKAIEASGLAQVAFETRTAVLSTDISRLSGFEWNSLEAFAPEKQDHSDQLFESMDTVLQASSVIEDYYPVRIAVLNQHQERLFIQAAQSDQNSSMMFAPKVTVFNGQKVNLCKRILYPFVTGLKKQDNGKLKPVLDVIGEGVTLTLRPVFEADCATIQLNGRIDLSQILEISNFTSEIQGKEATIQIPRVYRRRISVASSLKDEQCLLVCIPPSPHEKLFQYLMLKVRFLNTK